MEIFRFSIYSQALKALVEFRKKMNEKVTFSHLSQAMGVQKTYVSKVLKGDAHLNADQLFLGCRFLGLSDEETDYLLLLLEYERSSQRERKALLLKRIKGIQAKHRTARENLKVEFVKPTVGTEFTDYYLDPMSLIVHAHLLVPKYQVKPRLIRENLKVSEKRLEKILKNLERIGLVEWRSSEERYIVLKDSLHLDSESVLNSPYQALMRMVSTEQLLRLSPEEKFHIAVTISADETTRVQIQTEFMAFLKRVEPIVKEAPAEEVYQMNFDLFPWEYR